MLFAWLGYLVTSASPNIDVRVFRSTLVLHSLYGAAGVAYLAYLVLRRRLPGPTRLDWPIAALILALLSYPLVLTLIPAGLASFRWAGHSDVQIRYETEYFLLTILFTISVAASSSLSAGTTIFTRPHSIAF
mgnify:CR=1 FL=1